MSATVTFEAPKSNLPFMRDWPVIRRSSGNFASKTELTDYIDSFLPSEATNYAAAICSCGKQYEWATKDDVPATELDCTCGKKITKYGA
jgi:hypothetical protein